MPAHSVSGLVQAIRNCGLLEPQQLQELLRQMQASNADPRTPFHHLIERGWLTRFQIQKLLHNCGPELVLGSYVILDKLGEGGMGEVFKARHQKMGRVVALKLIRKDRLKNPESIERFKREIKVTAQLSHPNIVMALDADQAGDMHFLVMEYVEGTDLGKLTRTNGPQAQAIGAVCDYFRQAALGLQHAFSKGLVHRDIKPSNLVLAAKGNIYGTAAGTIKILDLGLARLQQAEGDAPNNHLTQLGKVVGTVDFIAPEQALDSHKADVRSDLYSLGGTFYYVLTGKLPFPGADAMEKLMRHRMDDVPSPEKLRPEVPPAVSAIVRKLLAKKPEDRFQTPAELAAELVPFCKPDTPSGVRKAMPVAALADKALPIAGLVALPAGNVPVAMPAALPAGDYEIPVAEMLKVAPNGNLPVAALVGTTRPAPPRFGVLHLERTYWLIIAGVLTGALIGLLVLAAL